ncbi:MAG: DUF190 domain-containing protein [Actinobacteria bacterium]|nr:DUF190 domain-containing protein [Actinomycetota bacterium]
MKLDKEGVLLRIFIGEADKKDGIPLYQAIVEKARKDGLAGATVLKGIMGYGASSRIHFASVLRLSEDLPVVVEIVDTRERIENFLDEIQDWISEGLVTIENVNVMIYRHRT